MPTTITEPVQLRPGIQKIIHMVGQQIRANKALGELPDEDDYPPCMTVKCVDGTFHCRSFHVHGLLAGEQKFKQKNRRREGAVAWLTTRAAMTLFPEA
jgi:hypothetical protein